jgi:hypothetical protein
MTTPPASPAVRCPHCGQEIPLGKAIVHQLAAPLRAGWEAEMRQQIGEEVRRRAEEDLRSMEEGYQEQLRRKDEEYGTTIRQHEEQLKRVSAEAEELRRKSSTSLRQQEGIARQDLFGEELQRRFPADLIKVTPAGKRGPDVVQIVRAGPLDCGVILWECKRTAKWGSGWAGKLAGEVRSAGASFGVIVSEVLPAGMDGSGQAGDVWLCDYAHASDLAAGLRQAIIAVSHFEAANAARAGIAGKVYDYIVTGGFQARYKAMEQALDRLAHEIDQELRTTQQRCKRLERIRVEIREEGLHGIVLDIIGLGGEIPPAARDELPEDGPPELPPGQ